MTAELFKTDVNMDGLLEVLGKNLYSSPKVAIRELVQNAHDACVRRQLEEGAEVNYRIRLVPDGQNKTLKIVDNGSGLTRTEIQQYLATIGSGYTRVLRNQTQTEDMIGYFGLGFLSTYVVSDRVMVTTSSYQTPESTWKFVSKGGKSFSIEATSDRGEIGSTVHLDLSEEFHSLSDASILENLLRRYCSLIRVPIFIGDSELPINGLSVPWRTEYSSQVRKIKESAEFVSIFENDFSPICTIDIPKDNPLGLNGVIWVQDAGGYATSDYRNVSVFIRDMFITQEGRDLLPQWAGFVGCVIESNQLVPTASREDIQKTEFYYKVQDFLSKTLIDGLKNISTDQPENWKRILTRHNQSLLGAAVADDGLFDLLNDGLTLPTTNGDMTVRNILDKSDNKFYVQLEEKNNFEQVLFKANKIPVVLGYMFAASSFCNKYSGQVGVQTVNLGTAEGNKSLFTLSNIDSQVQEKLEACFGQEGVTINFANINPSEIPMVIVENQEVARKKRIENGGMTKRMGAAALMLARLHTEKTNDGPTKEYYLNLQSNLIQKIINEGNINLAINQAKLVTSFSVILCSDSTSESIDFHSELQKFNTSLLEMLS